MNTLRGTGETGGFVPAPGVHLKGLTPFLSFVTKTLGIEMNSSKLPMLQSRLMRRLRDLQLESMDEYADVLFGERADPGELQHFIDAVTTNKTDFFREPQHFTVLVETLLPVLAPRSFSRGAAPWSFKLWSAPCSSGEEPYSLAMVLAEYALRQPRFDFSILGTDVSYRMLEHAKRAIYDHERIEPIPPELRTKYLLRARDPHRLEMRVVPELRKRVTLQRLNFMDRDYGIRDTFDVVFCRNVLIYFDKPTQALVVRRLARHLRPDGYLFLGHSESLAGLDVPFESSGSSVYRHTARS